MPANLLLQTPGTPVIFAAFSRLFGLKGLKSIRIAVAFATKPGVDLLMKLLNENQGDEDIDVSALIGLDRYMTEPAALELLASDSRVELRVFESPPNSMFHAKAYFFDGEDESRLLVGSSNLSAAALIRNRESAYVVETAPGSSEHEVWSRWWESVWGIGTPCDTLKIAEYAESYDPADSSPSDTQDTRASEPSSVSSVAAERLWMGTASVTGAAGTQLELPKETVGYFLDTTSPPSGLNLTLVRGAESWLDNHMAFYQNDMWRINLSGDIPEVAAMDLAYKYVLFRRAAKPDTYYFEVVSGDQITDLRAASVALGQHGETSTRDYGWL